MYTFRDLKFAEKRLSGLYQLAEHIGQDTVRFRRNVDVALVLTRPIIRFFKRRINTMDEKKQLKIQKMDGMYMLWYDTFQNKQIVKR